MKAAIVKSPTTRPKRTNLNVRNRLTVANKDPEYVYRIVNDVEDRADILKEIGYEVVPASDVKVGDKRVDVGTSVGSPATLALGQGLKGVVMRIKKEWYDEDQAAKQAEVDATEESMKPGGTYGQVKVGRGDPNNF